ncbi:2-keto-4-pentenoate hydratase [Desulfomonile tiedjei]|uniref:2-keto-4-pentenoate hydratase n=1 Tax=Desulfomonile tiedjei (strain ATCC 49306 / DSM 6799 / DCB-1) TaxID=706587 RepID=I4CAZ1_DESTA|nr:2-keto-4-pentenoate hydratase [Desulfomonile tiedjei]AFM26732.1 2-keto-4-pentenoate hydratase [Desulfomonile tiedjei DSM 6799]
MRKTGILSACAVAVLVVLVCFSWAGEEEVINSIVAARTSTKTFPLPSAQIPDLDLNKAYALQRTLTERLVKSGHRIGGFKAGLTSEAGQKRFGVDRPLLGPLFKSGELEPGVSLEPKDFTRLFIEVEIGYLLGDKITEPVQDVETLKKKIKEVFPAVELPDLRFDDMKNLKGADIVVDAVSSSKYIVGRRMPADKVDVSAVSVILKLDGNEINKGQASDALGDQWKALLWLVNSAVEQGWTLEPGYIFITGALGNMLPGKPGKYEADWGSLGKISWTVK